MRVVVVQEVGADPQRVRAGLVGQVVDDLVHAVRRGAVGLLESVPNEATPAMLTAGPIGSVGERLQVAVGELRACLEHRARRQRQRVAEGDRLVDVVEPGGRAGRVEAAGAARVARS